MEDEEEVVMAAAVAATFEADKSPPPPPPPAATPPSLLPKSNEADSRPVVEKEEEGETGEFSKSAADVEDDLVFVEETACSSPNWSFWRHWMGRTCTPESSGMISEVLDIDDDDAVLAICLNDRRRVAQSIKEMSNTFNQFCPHTSTLYH